LVEIFVGGGGIISTIPTRCRIKLKTNAKMVEITFGWWKYRRYSPMMFVIMIEKVNHSNFSLWGFLLGPRFREKKSSFSNRGISSIA
jgi:hypothetical protein